MCPLPSCSSLVSGSGQKDALDHRTHPPSRTCPRRPDPRVTQSKVSPSLGLSSLGGLRLWVQENRHGERRVSNRGPLGTSGTSDKCVIPEPGFLWYSDPASLGAVQGPCRTSLLSLATPLLPPPKVSIVKLLGLQAELRASTARRDSTSSTSGPCAMTPLLQGTCSRAQCPRPPGHRRPGPEEREPGGLNESLKH